MSAGARLAAGELLAERYLIEQVLEPGLAVARDRRLGATVVIKATPVADREILAREFLALRPLAHHGARRVYDLGETSTQVGEAVAFYTMEQLGGEHLAARMARAPLGRVELGRLAGHVAQALAAVRAAGLAPGTAGLEPEQVWLSADAQPRAVLSHLTLSRDPVSCRPSARLERLLARGRRGAHRGLALGAAGTLLAAATLLLASGRTTHPAPGATTATLDELQPAPFVIEAAAPGAARAFVVSGPTREVIEAIARDPSGDLLVTGSAEGDVFLGATHLHPAAAALPLAFVLRLAPDGTVRWVRRFAADRGVALSALALAGDTVVVAGALSGALEIDGQRLASTSAQDCLVASLDARSGALRWLHSCGAARYPATARAVVADPAGNVYVVGDHHPELFVVSYDREGALRWQQHITGSATMVEASAAVVVGDELIVGGALTGSLRIGAALELASTDGSDALLFGLSLATGEPRHGKLLGGRGADAISALARGEAGEVIAVGQLGDGAPGAGPVEVAGPRRHAFVAALEPRTGTAHWLRRFATRGFVNATAVSVAQGGRILLAGSFELGLEIEDVQMATPDDEYDGFVVELDAEGRLLAHAQIGDQLEQAPHALLVDGDRLWLAGSFAGELHAAGLTLTATSSSDGMLLDLPRAWLTSSDGSGLR